MAIVVVGGSTKDIGKTALVCAVISALRDFEWTAGKITGHSYESADPVSTNDELDDLGRNGCWAGDGHGALSCSRRATGIARGAT